MVEATPHLLRLPLAAAADDYPAGLRRARLDVADPPGLMDLVAAERGSGRSVTRDHLAVADAPEEGEGLRVGARGDATDAPVPVRELADPARVRAPEVVVQGVARGPGEVVADRHAPDLWLRPLVVVGRAVAAHVVQTVGVPGTCFSPTKSVALVPSPTDPSRTPWDHLWRTRSGPVPVAANDVTWWKAPFPDGRQ
ncbi:MAG TPA: hypothetical protein VD866_29235 [Urbifossiella sp.]|nr:hypothetical protein [Urbifossiella sp.]